MSVLTNIKNSLQGVFFDDYKEFVTDKIFINSLKHTFNRIKSKPDSEKIASINRFERDITNLNPEDFANLENLVGCSLLQLAASNLNSEAVAILLENGADVNHLSVQSPFKGFTPLTYALGTKGKIIFPPQNISVIDPSYDIYMEKEERKVLRDPKDFESFKATVDLLLSHGGVAIAPLSPVFTEKGARKKTAFELVEFAISFLENNENFRFYKKDENGEKAELDKFEMMEYLLSIDLFRENISPELLSYAKQNDYTSFSMLLEAVDDKVDMLNRVHEYEATEMRYYHNKTLIQENAIRKMCAEMREKGLDPDNLPICPERFAYEKAMREYSSARQTYETISAAHMILTEYDSEETFNFKYLPYYNHRYKDGIVVDLYSPTLGTAVAYLREAGDNEIEATENYLSDIIEIYPRILKHGDITYFAKKMGERLDVYRALQEEFQADLEEEELED